MTPRGRLRVAWARLAHATVLPLAVAAVGDAARPAVAAPPASPAQSPSRSSAAPQRPESRVTFHGWSPDSSLVAYSREKLTPPKRAGGNVRRKLRNLHRTWRDGDIRGFGPKVEYGLADYAAKRGYVRNARAPAKLDARLFRFDLPEGPYLVDIRVDDALEWVVSLDGRVLARQPFDALYVGFDVELHPAPDRRGLVVVMHLDRGWTQEAAVYPIVLPEWVGERWRALHVTPPEGTARVTPGESPQPTSQTPSP